MSKSEVTAALQYDRELGPGFFTLTPNDFLENNPDLSATAKLLYITLLMHCGRGDTAFPGQDRLCSLCGCKSRTTLGKAIDELEAIGLIEVVRRGLRLPNLYIVHKYELVAPGAQSKNVVQNMNIRNVSNVQNMNVKRSNPRTSKRSYSEQELDPVELDPIKQEDIVATIEPEPPIDEATRQARILAQAERVSRQLQGGR